MAHPEDMQVVAHWRRKRQIPTQGPSPL